MNKELASKSIEELEGIRWERPQQGASNTLIRCFESRRKPLSKLDPCDLRVLISQDVALPFVVPIALELLEHDPLLETEHYKGDLLAAVLRTSHAFFKDHPLLKQRVERILERLPIALDALDHINFDVSSEALQEGSAYFRGDDQIR